MIQSEFLSWGTPVSADRSFDGCGAPEGANGGYLDLLARLKRQHVPYAVLWELTHKCNLDCIMCYNAPLAQPELSTEECFEILDQLASAGVLRLTLTGGEILTRRDFFAIAEHARLLGFALNLKTNGTLITATSADHIAAVQPVQVDISLLGATDHTFDAIAGSYHTLERVLRGIRLLQDRGVRVKLNTLLMDLNAPERSAMFEIARDLGVNYEQVFKISSTDDGANKASQHQLSRTQITEALHLDQSPFTARQVEPENRTCSVGLSSCLISPYGEVFPCIELRISAGNLRQQRFADIWANAPIFQELRTRHTYRFLPECFSCPINRYCEGRCSGLAWKEHGNLYRGHSLACLQAQARFAQVHPNNPIPTTPLQTRLGSRPTRSSSAPTHPADSNRLTSPIALVDLVH